MSESSTRIYCFDSSAFIRINRFYPKDIFLYLWEELESLIKEGQLISHIYVRNEIYPKTGKTPDALGQWISDKTSIFFEITQRQVEIVTEILKEFPGLIDYRKEQDDADPWVIALAKEVNEKESLFSKEIIVVSEESIRASNKIPAVCNAFEVGHMTLFEFFQDRGWTFKLQK